MSDSLVSRHIPALFNGVSQQNPTLRQPSQAEGQVNMWGTVQDGLRKRPPFQHVSLVTAADIESAHVHTINRDVNERYVVVVTDGDLKVYDADTGVEKTVNFPTGKAYLSVVGGGQAAQSFALDSIADYTFVCNKTVVTATKATPVTTPTNWTNWYTPAIWGNAILSQYYSTYGAGVLTGTVSTFSDLPHPEDAQPPVNGDLYKVVGLDEANFGGYYVRRVAGYWEETYGPGANITLDDATMPHALVREGDGTFTFAPFAWKPRRFGDAETNPEPTFVGRTINGVFYWKNRLGFITDENVVLSCANDFGNFWRNTATTLIDSDVVDVAVSTNKVSILQYAVPFAGNMMLFADQSQYSLNVTDILTPTSVSIDEATGYEMNKDVRPAAIGSDVYFVSRTGNWSRIREYFVDSEVLNTDAADVTAHVQRYVPKDVFKLAGSDTQDALFVATKATGERHRLYVYKFYWRGDEKLQSAWNYWELDAGDTVLSVDSIEDKVYVLIKRTDGAYLEVADLDSGAVTGSLEFDILLDRRYEAQPIDMVYSAGQNETTITVPYDLSVNTQGDWRVVLTAGSGNIGRLVDPTSYSFPAVPGNDAIVVPGDVTGYAPVVGLYYDAWHRFSEQFVYDGNNDADTTGRLQLRTFTVTFTDAGYFETKVYPYGLDFAADVEEIIPAALDAFTGRMLGESTLITGEADFFTGDYMFYIDGHAEDVVIELHNPSHLQTRFNSAEWEGYFTKRSRSM